MTEPLKFTKVETGWYATPDGKWCVQKDAYGYGYIPIWKRDEYGIADDGWALSYDPGGRQREDHQAGGDVEWFDTKRDAIAAANRYARREEMR